MPAEVVMQGHAVDRGVDVAGAQERGQGGGEAQPSRSVGQVQRLHAEPIAREHEPAAVALGEREGEHPLEALDAAFAPQAVGLQHHLGVAVGEEAQPRGFELAPQLAVVVDAAVEDDRQPELGVDHRLRAALGEVDDPQPAMTEGDGAVRPGARRRPGHAAPARRPSGPPARCRPGRRTTAPPRSRTRLRSPASARRRPATRGRRRRRARGARSPRARARRRARRAACRRRATRRATARPGRSAAHPFRRPR